MLVRPIQLVSLISSCSGENTLRPELTMEDHPTVNPFPGTDRNDPANPYRYIAHAGGEYHGITYTNSLEAMDLSASKGFMMFELDLILTGDNQIAAAHDWTHWKTISGYDKAIPPTLDDFKSIPVCGSLTPLSMADITAWFSTHHDAILVTDKITDYEKIATEFPYPERIMVEVFTLNGYLRALRAGIRYPLLSLDTAAAGPDGEWLHEFIIANRLPMAVLSTASIGLFREEITAVNANNGYVFAFTGLICAVHAA